MTVFVFLVLSLGTLMADMSTRRPGPERLSRSIAWSGAYVATSLLFALYLLAAEGLDHATLFLSAYTIEKAMSMDNLIIFAAVFAYFGIGAEHEHRVLHWGIVGSAVLRLVFIAAGLMLVFVFGRLLDLAFGIFVVWTAWKMLDSSSPGQIDHNKRWYIRWTRQILPVSPVMNGKFFVREHLIGRLDIPAVTPLFFCLLAIEFTDIAFAFDSVPAVIGLTRNTMLAYSSVMFAVLGLRSMYFVLEALKRYTESLSKAVIGILLFVGGKMILHGLLNIEFSAFFTLTVILSCLLAGIVGSVYKTRCAGILLPVGSIILAGLLLASPAYAQTTEQAAFQAAQARWGTLGAIWRERSGPGSTGTLVYQVGYFTALGTRIFWESSVSWAAAFAAIPANPALPPKPVPPVGSVFGTIQPTPRREFSLGRVYIETPDFSGKGWDEGFERLARALETIRSCQAPWVDSVLSNYGIRLVERTQ